ncbi:hypothetical protein [Nocardia sp. NPDC003963]
MVDDTGRAVIALGFAIAVGLPLVVLVRALAWPERTAEVPEREQRRDSQG